ncbi:hypothetical protein ACA910_015410 [Epithemia clementina (nom. ined.)]
MNEAFQPPPVTSNHNDKDTTTTYPNGNARQRRRSLLQRQRSLRDAKRQEMERLFQQFTSIQQQMRTLEDELCQLDERIDQLEDEEEPEQQQEPVGDKDHKQGTEEKEYPGPDETTSTTMLASRQLQIQQPLAKSQQQQQPPEPPAATSTTTTTTTTTTTIHPFFAPRNGSGNSNKQQQCNAATAHIVDIPDDDDDDDDGVDNGGNLQRQAPLAPTFATATAALRMLPCTATNHAPQTTAAIITAMTAATDYPWTTVLLEVLQSTFGIASYREHQEEIINATLQGQNVFVLMRTGGGKSLTYQLPALYEGRLSGQAKVTLVISPLLSLIQDQEEQMNALVPGSATSFTSGLGTSEQAKRWNMVRDPQGGLCLVFVTPEKVHKSNKLRTELQKLFDQNRLGRFVIDEAHCACQWGCDFRPDYAQLGILKRHFPTIPVLAVTATASTRVRQDVAQILGIANQFKFFRSTAQRPNLQYSIRSKQGEHNDVVLHDMAEWIQEHYPKKKNNQANENDDCSGIIYTLSRKDATTVARALNDQYGISARPYHSDVSPTQKQAIHREWMSNRIQVVVATIAFGLGINKPNVRFVLHHCISKTLEAYYQESGRAGRDGKPAHCVLYYSPRDVIRMRTLVHETHRGEENLIPMIRYAQASGNDAVCKAILMDNLGEPNAANPTLVQKDNDGITTETRDVGRHGQIVARLVQDAAANGTDVTMAMLVKQWRSKKSTTATTVPQYVLDYPPAADDLSVDECERIIIALLLERILCFHIHWTAYSAVAYLRLAAPRGLQLIQSAQPKMIVRFPKRHPVDKAAVVKKKKMGAKATASGGEWLQAKSKAAATTKTSKKRKSSAGAAGPKSKKKRPTKSTTTTGGKKRATGSGCGTTSKTKAATAAAPPARVSTETTEVIELCSDENDDDDDEELEEIPHEDKQTRQQRQQKRLQESLWTMNEEDDDDETKEFEFQDEIDDDDND